MTHQHTYTVAVHVNHYIIGYVQFVQRTSIGAEIHVGFHPNFRGVIAKAGIEDAIRTVFEKKGILKLWAIIPSDNRPAILLAKAVGFEPEGRITRAIMRGGSKWSEPGLKDLVILGLNRPDRRI